MNKHEKFINFLESITTEDNAKMIDVVVEAFALTHEKALQEAWLSTPPKLWSRGTESKAFDSKSYEPSESVPYVEPEVKQINPNKYIGLIRGASATLKKGVYANPQTIIPLVEKEIEDIQGTIRAVKAANKTSESKTSLLDRVKARFGGSSSVADANQYQQPSASPIGSLN